MSFCSTTSDLILLLNMILKAWINGKEVDGDEAFIPVSDLGLVRGFAIFDFLRTYNGKPFLLKNYVDRFMSAAELCGMNVSVSARELEDIIKKLVRDTGEECAIRILLTGGPGEWIGDKAYSCLIVTTETLVEYPRKFYEEGIVLLPIEYKREIPEVKTTNYFFPLWRRNLLRDAGADEFLYMYGGKILETSRANIFFVMPDGKIVAPSEGLLRGITRGVVIRLIQDKMGLTVEERDFNVEELEDTVEAFVTGSSRLVMPVCEISGYRKYTSGFPVTKEIQEHFMKFVKECNTDYLEGLSGVSHRVKN